jgi:hypothetical protein
VRHRLYLCSLAILIAGLCSGTAIYVLSDDLPDDGNGYIIVDGLKYPAGAYQSKRYQRELERYGGKANVIFDELNRWFASLWQGKKLGITLGWISVIASLGLSLLARYLYPKRDS